MGELRGLRGRLLMLVLLAALPAVLLALLAAREDSDAVHHGVRWLVETQREDGTWDEPQYTGTGFPGDFSINYHLYRLIFPVTALGRYVAAEQVIDLTGGAA